MSLRIGEGEFSVTAHEQTMAEHAGEIAAFRSTQQGAFAAERVAWAAAGEFEERPDLTLGAAPPAAVDVREGATLVESVLTANVWRIDVETGQTVSAGDPLLALEAMKTEIVVAAAHDGEVLAVIATIGQQVEPGSPLIIVGGGPR